MYKIKEPDKRYMYFVIGKDFFFSDKFEAIESLEEGYKIANVLIKLFIALDEMPRKQVLVDYANLAKLCHVRQDEVEKYIALYQEFNLVKIYNA